ncbi:MAG: signal peptidase I [Pseudomonadota bacterium]
MAWRSRREAAPKPKKTWGREFLESLGLAFLVYLIVANYAVAAYEIPSGSMLPTLQIGDHLLVNRCSYDLNLVPASLRVGLMDLTLPGGARPLVRLADPARGEIVVFQMAELGPEPLIKRVIGLPGETVQVRGGRVYINGQALADPWGRRAAQAGPGCAGDEFGPVTVPAGSYLVMGDNRCNSYDSRLWRAGQGGFVPRERILGQAKVIYWPGAAGEAASRMQRLGRLEP